MTTDSSTEDTQKSLDQNKKHKATVATMLTISIMVAMQGISLMLGHTHFLNIFALNPQNPLSLPNVVTFPFAHGNLPHLISNVVPLAVFAYLISRIRSVREFVLAFFIALGITGPLVWAFESPGALIVGASSIVAALAAYSFLTGYIEKHFIMMLFGGVVTIVALVSVIEAPEQTSTTAHIIGFATGATVLCGLYLFRWRKKTSSQDDTEHDTQQTEFFSD